MKVGVLAIQGDFAEHLCLLRGMGQETREVRLPGDLADIEALIIPGGESTTLSRLMDSYDLRAPIVQMAERGVPIWGTCAGMIMMAREVTDSKSIPMGLLDIQVVRNAFGRQVDSFEVDLSVKPFGDHAYRAIFIRAPIISRVGPQVEVLATLPDGQPAAVRQDNYLATAFHPELSRDTRFHRYFIDMLPDIR